MGARGFEPRTSSLSETRSNQLSYAPGDLPALRKKNSAMKRAAGAWAPALAWPGGGKPPPGPLPRKAVIQPLVPQRLPCYDFIPVARPTFDACPHCWLARRLRVRPAPMM